MTETDDFDYEGCEIKYDPLLCIYDIADIEREGFRVITTNRTLCVTEVHYNGPFHLVFPNGDLVPARELACDYPWYDLKSTHHVALCGPVPPNKKVAFRVVND